MLLAKAQTGDVIFWCLMLIGGIGILGVGVWLLRRWAFSTPKVAAADEWSLQHLRELRKRGEISEAEFERLRQNMIAQYQASRAGRADSAGEESAMNGGAGTDE